MLVLASDGALQDWGSRHSEPLGWRHVDEPSTCAALVPPIADLELGVASGAPPHAVPLAWARGHLRPHVASVTALRKASTCAVLGALLLGAAGDDAGCGRT